MIPTELKTKLLKKKAEFELARASQKKEEKTIQALDQHLNDIETARNIVQIVAQNIEQQAHKKIAYVVSACLQAVFPDKKYSFKIRFDRKRSRTEAKLVLMNDGNEIEDPMESESGGVLDVASFALQLSALLLMKPPVRRILILDEPFKYVSVQYRNNVNQLIESLAEEFGIQFLIVTHMPELTAGKTTELNEKG